MNRFLNLFLAIFIGAFSTSAQSQIYHHFPTGNASWNYLMGEPCQILLQYHSYSLVLEGDTVIGSNIYHKLNIPHVISWSQETNCPPFYWGLGYKGAIREDTLAHKLYYILANDSNEVLLYDFSLQIGDSVQGYIAPWSCAVVTAIDSIQFPDGWRKKWFYQTDAGPEEIVEGFGNIVYGLLDKICLSLDAHKSNLQCFSYNGLTMYPDSSVQCNIVNAISPTESLFHPLQLYPNPASNLLTIEYRNSQLNKVEVYNSLGEKTYSSAVHCASCMLNCASFPPGIYFIKAIANGKSLSARFIKE